MVIPEIRGVVAVIGAGSIGRRHADNLASLGAHVELVPWRSFSAKALASRADIAAVVIATATPIRLELIRLCAQQGWPFYAEKPLAWRRDQVEAIHTAARPVAERSMLGFMLRYHPAVRALATLDLTDIFRFQVEIGHDVRQWRANWRFSESYAAQEEGGGVLLDLSHEVDLASALFPGLTLRDAQSLGHAEFPGVDFATSLHLTTPGGATGTIAMDYLSPIFVRRLVLCGTGKRIELDLLMPRLNTITGATQSSQEFRFERNQMFLDAMTDFLRLVGDKPLPPDPLRPRFDQMEASSQLIATAWEQRQFTGNVVMAIS